MYRQGGEKQAAGKDMQVKSRFKQKCNKAIFLYNSHTRQLTYQQRNAYFRKGVSLHNNKKTQIQCVLCSLNLCFIDRELPATWHFQSYRFRIHEKMSASKCNMVFDILNTFGVSTTSLSPRP